MCSYILELNYHEKSKVMFHIVLHVIYNLCMFGLGELQIVQLFLNHIVQSYFYITRFSFEE